MGNLETSFWRACARQKTRKCARHLLVVVLSSGSRSGHSDRLGLESGDLGALGELVVGSLREVSTTPVTADLLSLVEVVGLGGRDEVGELTLVLGSDLLDEGNGGGLLVNKSTDRGLGLDNDVRDTHLAAEGGEEDDELDGVDVSGDDDESSLLGLDQGNTVVETVLDEEGLLAVSLGVGLLAVGDVLGSGIETTLLLLLGLGAVLVEQLEEVGGGVLVKGVGELGDRGGHLQALVKDNLLALEADILGPLDEAREVTRGLDVLACNGGLQVEKRVTPGSEHGRDGLANRGASRIHTNTEVTGALLEERVLGSLGGLALGVGGGGGLLGGSGLLGSGLLERKETDTTRTQIVEETGVIETSQYPVCHVMNREG